MKISESGADSLHVPHQTPDWWIDGATKSLQSVTSDWSFTGRVLIDGVGLKEVRPVPKVSGMVVEIFRQDWGLDAGVVAQAFAVVLEAGAISAWHVHEETEDRLFALNGIAKLVLYDARRSSPTFGMLNEFLMGSARRSLVTVPPGVWHGVQNVALETLTLLNLPDRAYDYQNPDHWRVRHDSPAIPYRFGSVEGVLGV